MLGTLKRFGAMLGLNKPRLMPLGMLAIAAGLLASPNVCAVAFYAPQASPALPGIWLGVLEAGGAKLRVVVNIKPDGKGFAATLDSPDQGASGIPVNPPVVEGRTLRLTVPSIAGHFEGQLSDDGEAVVGKWRQGGADLPLTLRRVDALPAPARPQQPRGSFPYREREVTYENTKDGVRLAGTLTLPEKGGPFPAVLLITGSGAQDRDQTLFGHKPFLLLADTLTRRGFAVLRVDDRGVGGSSGSMESATSEDFARDVRSGLEFLRAQDEIDPWRVGLLGHSEGALIAAMAAAESPEVAFVVMIAGTAVSGEELLHAQSAALMRAAGAPDRAVESARQLNQRLYRIVREEPDNSRAADRIQAAWREHLRTVPEPDRKGLGGSEAPAAQVKALLSPWFRFFLDFNPSTVIRQLRCPVLAIQGEKDLQVPSAQNLPAITAALEQAGNSDYTIVKLPGLNHLLQTARTGHVSEYGQIEETIAPIALEMIGGWLERVSRRQ